MTVLGYTGLARGAIRLVVRNDVVTRLGPWLLAYSDGTPPAAEAILRGRGGAYRLVLDGALRIVVRPCRRGGWLGRWITRTYVGWRPRPMRELAVSHRARERGAPTPAVLGVRVDGWGVYRGVVVTEELPGVTTLADAWAHASTEARVVLAGQAGAAIGRLHAAGVDHADLNLWNVLVCDDPTAASWIVDLDKARVDHAPLGAAGRRRNLARLRRSFERVTAGAPLPPAVRQAFAAAYVATGGDPCAC